MGAADNLTKREAAIAAFASEQATRIYSLLRHLPPRSRQRGCARQGTQSTLRLVLTVSPRPFLWPQRKELCT